ncbi:hypothetical protein ACFQ0K_08395 [Nocardioides caeni]|uniref:hypothetical protein n=1 Tax=Nocardioides caeni TaxID=574700 RepID=UPI0013C2DBA9|nr:hypothetical protein [Nocardioides caeni]
MPCEPTPIPEVEEVVWSDQRHQLTTHAAWVLEGRARIPVPWWSVADVAVRVGMGRSLAGTGDVVLIVDYPGYTDRRERRLNGVPDADGLAALCFAWSRRHRKAAGYL